VISRDVLSSPNNADPLPEEAGGRVPGQGAGGRSRGGGRSAEMSIRVATRGWLVRRKWQV
jgi:hypothetical protein